MIFSSYSCNDRRRREYGQQKCAERAELFFANLLKNHRIQFVHVDIGPVQEKQNALYITSRAGYSGKTDNFFGEKCGHFRTGNLSEFKSGRNEKHSVFKKGTII